MKSHDQETKILFAIVGIAVGLYGVFMFVQKIYHHIVGADPRGTGLMFIMIVILFCWLYILSSGLESFERKLKQLGEYFEGVREKFDLPFDVQGTPFQMQVWNQLSKIPYGETCSYRDIARKIKNAKAVRAVGTANGRNPLSIIVPCHRVIASNGSLGGYAGGVKLKTKLLSFEKNRA